MSSSSLAEVGYDEAARILEVCFHGGRVYRYFEVPKEVHRALMEADSLGAFLNWEIKGAFRYARVWGA